MSLTVDLDHDHGEMYVTLPNSTHIKIPLTEGGLGLLRDLLLAQHRQETHQRADLAEHKLASAWGKTGSLQSPVQYDIDRYLQSGGDNPTKPVVTKLPPKSRKISWDLSLEDLGL